MKTVKSGFNRYDPESIKREIDILKNLAEHRNIVILFHYFEFKGGIALLMEFAELGHLQTFMESQRPELLRCFGLFLDMAKGVEHLQTHNIVHRDLKPDNVLMFTRNNYVFCKIADFGTARYLEKEGKQNLTRKAPQWYGAPELPNGQYTDSVDVYSLGAIYFAMATLKNRKSMSPRVGNQILSTVVLRSGKKANLATKIQPYFGEYSELGSLVSSMIVDEYNENYRERRMPVSKVVDKLADHCEDLKNGNIVIRPAAPGYKPSSSYGSSASSSGYIDSRRNNFTNRSCRTTSLQDSTTGTSGYSSMQTSSSTAYKTSDSRIDPTYGTDRTSDTSASSYNTARSDITSYSTSKGTSPTGSGNAKTSDEATGSRKATGTTPETKNIDSPPNTGSSGSSNPEKSRNAARTEKNSDKPQKKSDVCLIS